jgi:hypothetical protein
MRHTYPLACIAVVAVYLAAWLSRFQYVYGWLQDDVPTFTKGLLTVSDWRGAFSNYNALQPYFYLISYLPLRSGLSLPSFPLPMFGDKTGQFRFFLLWALLLHAVLLLIWAWAAARFTSSRLAAWLSVVLLATSPTYVLWSPQPESRLLGLPFALPGLWLLLRPNPPARRLAAFGLAFLAGSLFGVAQSIHYTSLYLVAPVALVVWGLRLWHGWRASRYWLGLIGFGLGCVWQQALVEIVSDFIVGLPWQQGPTMTLLELRSLHSAYLTLLGNLALWTEWFGSQMGLPLLIAVAVGAVVFVRDAPGPGTHSRSSRLELTLGVLLALLYLGLSGTMAFFRQTSVLQPFLFLFASVAIVQVARWLGRQRQLGQAAVSAGLLIGVGIIPWTQAHAVFEAHQGLGRALEWVYAHKGSRPLIEYITSSGPISGGTSIEESDPDAWVLTYFPWGLLDNQPWRTPYLDEVQPLAVWPTLHSTDTLAAEERAYGHDDYRLEPVLNSARVTEVGALQNARTGEALPVATIAADSSANQAADPSNAFTHDSNPDASDEWVSADTPAPHYVEVRFARPVSLTRVWVALAADPSVSTPPEDTRRIAAMSVQVSAPAGGYRTVWQRAGLEGRAVVEAAWPTETTDGLRVVVERAVLPSGETHEARIAEIILPGYRVEAPARQNPLLPIVVHQISPNFVQPGGGDQQISVECENAIPGAVVLFDDTPLNTVFGDPTLLTAIVPRQALAAPGQHTIRVRSPLGLSDGSEFTVGLADAVVDQAPSDSADVLVVREMGPSMVHVGEMSGKQPDGDLTLWLDVQGGTPGTIVVLDGQPLPTFYAGHESMTAILPPDLYAVAATHQVYAQRGRTRSAPRELIVAPPVIDPTTSMAPLLIRDVSPANVHVGDVLAKQPDGTFALSLAVDGATPGTSVVLDGQPLATFYGGGSWVTAVLPADFYDTAANHQLYVTRGAVRSAPLDLKVSP